MYLSFIWLIVVVHKLNRCGECAANLRPINLSSEASVVVWTSLLYAELSFLFIMLIDNNMTILHAHYMLQASISQ